MNRWNPRNGHVLGAHTSIGPRQLNVPSVRLNVAHHPPHPAQQQPHAHQSAPYPTLPPLSVRPEKRRARDHLRIPRLCPTLTTTTRIGREFYGPQGRHSPSGHVIPAPSKTGLEQPNVPCVIPPRATYTSQWITCTSRMSQTKTSCPRRQEDK